MARKPLRSAPRRCAKLPNFPARFHKKYLVKERADKKTRCRAFSPKLLFQCVLELIAGTNGEGYLHALAKSFGLAKKPPVKSSLSKARAKVQYTFFEDLFIRLMGRFESHRQVFRGLRIYGIDGFELTLPRTDSVLKAGYRGRHVSRHRQMYYPRMYLAHCYDVLSGVTKDLRQFHLLDEISDAEAMIPDLEKNSLSIYDRLYICARLVRAHKAAKNYFLFRARRKGVPNKVRDFFTSPKKRATIKMEGVTVHLIKFENPKAKLPEHRVVVFATNLPRSWVNASMINHLYSLRWEVETSFRDLIQTMKIEQWHSKSINGILQELYAAFWLMNYSKIQIAIRTKRPKNPMDQVYWRPNFKLIIGHIADLLPKIFKRIQAVLKYIDTLMNFSTEKRKRRSRAYPRHLRGSATIYPRNCTVWVT